MAQTDFSVKTDEAGARLDATVAARREDLSRTLAQRLIAEGVVTVNGEASRPSYRLATGDYVRIGSWRPPSLTATPELLPLNIVYQDHDLAVIDKPPGLVVHPAAGHESGTLTNALTALFPQLETHDGERPGIVHRLDKDTSGLLVVALTPTALRSLQKQIADRSVDRRYFALIKGVIQPEEATIQAPIGRHRTDRKRMAPYGIAARPAQTSYRTVEQLGEFTLIEAKLHTGRTHQIRVHMMAVAHPIAGDTRYGGPMLPNLERQFLHAYALSFDSPSSGKRLSVTAPLPEDLQTVLSNLRGQQSIDRH